MSAAAEDAGPTHFQVDQTFNVTGVGTVVSGTVIAGHIDTGQHLMLGPTPSGGFADVTVTGIQRAQVRIFVCEHCMCIVKSESGQISMCVCIFMPPGLQRG